MEYKRKLHRITFTVKYSPVLEAVTGTDCDKFTVDLDAKNYTDIPFSFAMFSVENIHPKLFERYPPVVLAFSLNGEATEEATPLKDGDEVWFGVLE